MPYRFLCGDTVRCIGESLDMIVTQTADDGTRYLITQYADDITSSGCFSEEELELVKRARDDEIDLRGHSIVQNSLKMWQRESRTRF